MPSVIIAIAVASIPNFARVSRSAIVPEKEREYVLAAHVVGASTSYLILRTLLPNLIGPLMVLISLGFAYAVLYEASLSFLGLGAQPPTPEWGTMLSTALGRLTFAHLDRLLDGVVTVTEEEIARAMLHAATAARLVAEPSGATAIAAWLFHQAELPADGVTAIVVSGGNVDPARYRELLAAGEEAARRA